MTDFACPRHAAHSRETGGLSPGELLVLQSFRRWVIGHRCRDPRQWTTVWNDLAGTLGGKAGRQALNALIAMIQTICSYAGRTIEHHQPCCRCLGDDELCVLALVGHCQRAEFLAARDLAESLVVADGVPELLGAAGRLAAVLDSQGHEIACRLEVSMMQSGPMGSPRPSGVTLH